MGFTAKTEIAPKMCREDYFAQDRSARKERNEEPLAFSLIGRASHKPHGGRGCRTGRTHGIDPVRQAAEVEFHLRGSFDRRLLQHYRAVHGEHLHARWLLSGGPSDGRTVHDRIGLDR